MEQLLGTLFCLLQGVIPDLGMSSGCLALLCSLCLLRAVPGVFPHNCFALPQLLKEAVESQRMCELMKQQETHLKQQVSSLLCVLSLFC